MRNKSENYLKSLKSSAVSDEQHRKIKAVGSRPINL